MNTPHKTHALLILLVLTMTACQTGFRAVTTTDINLKREYKNGDVCVRETKTKVNNCSVHRPNKSCNRRGDTLIWTWKESSETSPFSIKGKHGQTSPFLPDAACTGSASTVTCTIDRNTTVDVFDYSVVVNPGTSDECKMDPRILIN